MTNPDEFDYTEHTGPDPEVAEKVAALIEARRSARDCKDFETADRIRAILDGAGVIVTDSPEVTAWKAGPDFDPAKLDAAK